MRAHCCSPCMRASEGVRPASIGTSDLCCLQDPSEPAAGMEACVRMSAFHFSDSSCAEGSNQGGQSGQEG